jgi:hypothetical protein
MFYNNFNPGAPSFKQTKIILRCCGGAFIISDWMLAKQIYYKS